MITTLRSALPGQWQGFVVAMGALALLAGLVGEGTFRELPTERLLLSLELALLSSGLAWLLRRVLRWTWAGALAAVWLLALAFYTGPVAVLGAALLGLGALSLGLCWTPVGVPGRPAIATISGLAAIAAVCGWAVSLPIHTRWTWLALLLAPALLQRKAVLSEARSAMAGWHAAVASAPRAAAACVLLLGLASTACWIPTMQGDDLTYHLGLPTQFLAYGRYLPDPAHQVWAYAPWASDCLHAITFVLAGADARGALCGLWLVLCAGAVWSIATSLRSTPLGCWMSLGLFASLPPLVWMASSMQTELAATAMLLGLFALIVKNIRGGLLAGAILFGGLFALKLVHGVEALPLLVFAAWRHRGHIPWRLLLPMALIAALAGASSYTQSWLATGNPSLPLFNTVFQSPYFPVEEYRDERWFAGFGLDLPWQMTFHTSRYVEASDGGLGFVLIGLAGVWVIALARSDLRGPMLAATAAFLLPLVPMQYARYVYPPLALLCVLLPLGLDRMRTAQGKRWPAWLLIGICMLNMAYQANASWLHRSVVIKRTIRSGADLEQVLLPFAPGRLLLRQVPDGPDEIVLFADNRLNSAAELAGRGRTVGMHDPAMEAAAAAAEKDPSGAMWVDLFARERIRWVLLSTDTASSPLRAGLQRAGGHEAARLRHAELWELPHKERP